MTPATQEAKLRQADQLQSKPMEKAADRHLAMVAVTEPESLSNALSLLIWRARETGQHEIADLILRMETQKGPTGALVEAIGREAPDLAAMGPEEAGDELLAIATDRLSA